MFRSSYVIRCCHKYFKNTEQNEAFIWHTTGGKIDLKPLRKWCTRTSAITRQKCHNTKIYQNRRLPAPILHIHCNFISIFHQSSLFLAPPCAHHLSSFSSYFTRSIYGFQFLVDEYLCRFISCEFKVKPQSGDNIEEKKKKYGARERIKKETQVETHTLTSNCTPFQWQKVMFAKKFIIQI